MWNDEGTYLLKKPDGPAARANVRTMSADDLIAHAERCKVKVKDGRLDFPRDFPAYASGNRYVSNVPGSTMFVPVTEVTRQYINGLFYVLAQEPGQRPVFVDDFNLFLPCGCERWVKSKFLNKEIPIPLSFYAKGRTEYEAMLLLQNLALVAQSMGLGGWIHAAFETTILLGGYPDIGPGLGFPLREAEEDASIAAAVPCRPRRTRSGSTACCSRMRRRTSRTPTRPSTRSSPRSTARQGSITTADTAAPGMKPDAAAAFAREAPHVEPEVIEVVRADLPLHLEDLRPVSRALPRDRFGGHLDAVPPHRSRSSTIASSGRRTRRRRPRMPRRGMAERDNRMQF